jgi:hypothetical protein
MRNGKSGTGYMELNTINKTGTWSETADRINSNFSKISIEVEEIKQNGGGGSGGGGGDVTNADHANSAYTLDKDTPVQNWFLSALNDDDAQGIINYLKGLKISGNLINRIVKQGDKDVTYTDEDVMSALRVMTEIENSAEKLKEIFLRKDVADSTKYLLSLLGGVLIKKYAKFGDFVTGVSGGYIDEKGDMEMGSGVFRKRLFVPEIAYNRTTLFCCYCGLRFSDFKQLTCKNLVTVDGKEWLVLNSVKTGVKLNIPLYLLFNGKALGIMRKYDSIEQLAALGCNSDTNRTLQKLGRMAHIGKKFTYHTSRHTCATLLVHQGVPITTVQKLLGHTSVKTTEIYSEVFDETIIKDLTRANQKYYNRRNVKQNQIKSQKSPEKYIRQ